MVVYLVLVYEYKSSFVIVELHVPLGQRQDRWRLAHALGPEMRFVETCARRRAGDEIPMGQCDA
jgi:hypothetical protein